MISLFKVWLVFRIENFHPDTNHLNWVWCFSSVQVLDFFGDRWSIDWSIDWLIDWLMISNDCSFTAHEQNRKIKPTRLIYSADLGNEHGDLGDVAHWGNPSRRYDTIIRTRHSNSLRVVPNCFAFSFSGAHKLNIFHIVFVCIINLLCDAFYYLLFHLLFDCSFFSPRNPLSLSLSLFHLASFAVVHYANPAEHVLSGDHHADPNAPSTYDVAFGIDHNLSSSMGLANFTADWTGNTGLDVPIGLVADEIMNSCRRKSVIGQVLQAVRFLLWYFVAAELLIPCYYSQSHRQKKNRNSSTLPPKFFLQSHDSRIFLDTMSFDELIRSVMVTVTINYSLGRFDQ